MEPETPDMPVVPTVPPGGNGSGAGTVDRFAAEKEWREQEEASARISYATGETDYIAYTRRMDEIAVEFSERQLKHTDLTETERLKITAEWREAQKKQQEHFDAESLEAENNRYNAAMAALKQQYIDGAYPRKHTTSKPRKPKSSIRRNLWRLPRPVPGNGFKPSNSYSPC